MKTSLLRRLVASVAIALLVYPTTLALSTPSGVLANGTTTTTTLTSSLNPSVFGQAVTFTATVTNSGSPVTSGTVTFREGGSVFAPGLGLDGSGQSSFTTSSLTVGTHTITAEYSGDGTNEPSSGFVDQVVDTIATSTVVTSSLNPSAVGDSVTFTATVTNSGSPVTSGTVTFREGGSVFAPGLGLDGSGQSSFTTSSLTVGTHTISADYGGDSMFATSSGSVGQVVNEIATSTVVTSSLNPSFVGDSVTFTATVTSSGSPVTSGTLTFKDGALVLASGISLNASGQSTLTTSTLSAGSHTISAEYSGDATLAPSSATVGQQVDKRSTSTVASSSLNPSVVGDSVTFTATVTNFGSPVTSGTVAFMDGASALGSPISLNGSGQASLTTSSLAAGSHTISAEYSGDATYLASSGSVEQQVDTPSPPPADTNAPTVSNVNTILREGGHIGSVSVVVSWSAADDLTPTDRLVFQIQRRRLRALGWTAWQDVATVTGQTSLYQVPLWHRYQYRVRARDQGGNWSAWSESLPITFIRRDERHFTRDATWTITPVAGAMRGRVARSTTPGGTATLSFTGNGIALVATTGPGQGTVMVCIDPGTAAQSCRTVDLSTLPTGLKQLPVVFSLPWATHTLQVTVIAGNIDLDGAIFSR